MAHLSGKMNHLEAYFSICGFGCNQRYRQRFAGKRRPALHVFCLLYTLIRVSWATSGSSLKFGLYDFNDYDDDWARF